MAAAAPPPAEFELITNQDSIDKSTVLLEDDFIQQSLYWIGFTSEAQRAHIMTDAFDTIRDIKVLSEEDIKSLAQSFASRNQADGRILFGLKRTKYLKGFAHFIQDFFRISQSYSTFGR